MTGPRFSIVVLLVAGAHSSLAADLAREWQARYDGLSKVVRDRNFGAFLAYTAPDFTWTPYHGKPMSRKAAREAFAPMFKAESITGGEQVMKAIRKGKRVEVTCYVHYKITSGGKTTSIHEVDLDLWEKRGAEWKIVQSITKQSK